jgi:hypothetical protein
MWRALPKLADQLKPVQALYARARGSLAPALATDRAACGATVWLDEIGT